MFNDGCSNSAHKMNPGKMRETVMHFFPHRFSIPSELEIKTFITSESQKKKNSQKQKKIRKKRKKNEWCRTCMDNFIATIDRTKCRIIETRRYLQVESSSRSPNEWDWRD